MAGSRPISAQRSPKTSSSSRDLVGKDVEVELVAVARRQPERVVLAVAADQQLDPGRAHRARAVGHVLDLRVATLEAERRLVLAGHPPDDLEVLAEPLHPLLERRIVVAVLGRLVLAEAGAETEGQATAADGVQGRGRLGGHRRVVERRVHDDRADPDPRHERREPGRQRPAVEFDRLARPLRDHVLPGPDRLEAESLGGQGELDDARPGARRLPALELVEVPLREDEADLHRHRSGARGRRGAARRRPPAGRR